MSTTVKSTLKRLNAITDRENLIEELAKETGRPPREVEKHLNDVRFEKIAVFLSITRQSNTVQIKASKP